MSLIRRTLASIAVAALAGAPTLALAAEPGAMTGDVTVRQSVKTELTSSGAATTSRVFTQVASSSEGTIVLPRQATGDLRNLTGYGAPDVDDDAVSWDLDEPGARRSVADFDGDLPVTFEVTYELDGQAVEPGDVVGETGMLTVTYHLTNATGIEQELTFKDAQGNRRTETVEVFVPLVGSFSTVLDGRFRDVEAPGGVLAGDGRGNTVVNFSLLLFPPLGQATSTVSYTAFVEDAVIPPSSAQVVPVNSDSFRSLASAEETYRSAAGDVYELTQGAMDIDRNLLRLATGLSTLLDGVGQLADGASELHVGLGDAADGSSQLAEGLGQARAGGSELDAGLGLLAAGAGELSAGLDAASAGGSELDAGLQRLADGAGAVSAGLGSAATGGAELDTGLVQLAGGAGQVLGGLQELKTGINDPVEGLPAARDGVALLSAGVTKMMAGIGSDTTPDTLRFGTKSLSDALAGLIQPGIADIGDGATDMIAKVDNVPGCIVLSLLDPDPTNDTECGAKDLLAYMAANGDPASMGLSGALLASIGSVADAAIDPPPTLLGGLKATEIGAGQLVAGIGSAAAPGTVLNGVARVSGGLSNPAALDPANPGFNPTCETAAGKQPCGLLEALTVTNGGLALLDDGLASAITSLNEGLGSTDVPGETLLYGMGQVAGGASAASEGAGDLADGLGQLDAGAQELAVGAGDASTGAGDLADGLGQLDAGGKQLASGAGDASDGAGQLADGLGQLDNGGRELAAGLGSAEDGAGQIANGLALARIGANSAASGASELNERGTSVLADAVNEKTAETELVLAQVRAADERGRTDALPYGAPDGAVATAVYQFDLAGVGAESGPSEGVRIVTAAGGFGVAGGLGFLARRRFGLG